MKNTITKLSCWWNGHRVKLLGHTEHGDIIRLHTVCTRCGYKDTSDHLRDDPWIDEDSPRRTRFTQWSGYSWWLHKPIRPDDTLKNLVED